MATTRSNWTGIVDIIREFRCTYRLKLIDSLEPSSWESLLFIPTDGYLEGGSIGPVPVLEVEWIEIRPIELRRRGQRVPDLVVDHTKELAEKLSKDGIEYEASQDGFRMDCF